MCTAFLAGSSTGFAVDIPTRDTAGAEQQRFEKQGELQQKAKQIRRDAEETQEAIDDEKIPAQDGGKAFELKAIRITGNEAISAEELKAQVQMWVGETIRFNDLQKIASELKQYYREKKFIAAYVFIPPQKIKEGVVEFSVIEGRLGQVTIEGNKWYSEKTLKRAAGLREGKVIYFRDLNQGVETLNKNPDIKARVALQPGQEPKTTDIVFKVKDKFPVHLNTEVNNLGTESTGRTRWGIGATHNNLLGFMDQLSARFQLGSGAWALGTRYAIPVGPWQTQLGFSYSRSAVHLGGDFKDLNIRGNASTYGFDLTQPFWRNEFFKAALTGGFDIKSVENKILGVKAGKDELRILNTGFNLEEVDRWGRTYNPHSFHIGFADFLGSSNKSEPAATRAGTGGQFFIYRSTLVRYTRLPAGITHAVRGEAQLTPDRLAPSEQFRLGGAFSVRGYSEGDYMADYGGLVVNEIYIPTYIFPKSWVVPYSNESLQQAIQLVGFFDFGGGALRKPLTGEDRSKMLAGAGGGLRIHLFDRVFARLQWAGRLGNKSNDGTNGAFYYGVSAET